MTPPKSGTWIQETVVLRVVGKAVLPFILLFAFYVQFHGDFGPGGGFQAGVIFAAGLILYGLVFGLDALREAFSPKMVEAGVALGVLLYGGVGVTTIVKHGAFLSYGKLLGHDATHGQHIGIMLVELGVGVTVASVMTAIFYAFGGRSRR